MNLENIGGNNSPSPIVSGKGIQNIQSETTGCPNHTATDTHRQGTVLTNFENIIFIRKVVKFPVKSVEHVGNFSWVQLR